MTFGESLVCFAGLSGSGKYSRFWRLKESIHVSCRLLETHKQKGQDEHKNSDSGFCI